ncbi:MAG TPA: glycosyltransferase family protein, partial [Polyangiaceae bacterium]
SILRPEILSADRRAGEHLLVYQTAEGNEALTAALAASGLECRIYGMRRGLGEDVVEGNLTYRPFSEGTFILDLATSRAVVAGGGFTLMSESVFLHKPMLSMPVVGQFEQTLNALYLEREGFGRHARALTEPALRSFLDALPACEERLSQYSQDGNRLLFAALDELLDALAAGV